MVHGILTCDNIRVKTSIWLMFGIFRILTILPIFPIIQEYVVCVNVLSEVRCDALGGVSQINNSGLYISLMKKKCRFNLA